MARKPIGLNLDDNDMNNANSNFIELYNISKLFTDFLNGSGTVTSTLIAPNSVTSGKVAENAINDKHIANKTLSGLKVANGTLPGMAIEPNSITELRIGTRQISHRHLSLGLVEDENISLNAKIQHTKIDGDQFTMSKGKTYPFYSESGQTYPKYDNAVYELYITNAEVGAQYKLTDISKDNEAFGRPVTYIRIMKSIDDGLNWSVLTTRGDANLPNEQKGIKSHHITHINMREEVSITIDWDSLSTGHNTNGVDVNDYIVAPSNLIYSREKEYKKPLKLLLIGNSFSTDSAEYLYDICKSVGMDVIVGVSFDSGIGLKETWEKLQNDGTITAYQKWTPTSGRVENRPALLKNIVVDEEWDIVTFQQVSNFSDDESSFNPYLTNLIEYAKNNITNPKLRFGLNMTWAFSEGSNRITNMGYSNQLELYESISETYQSVMKNMDIDILLPTGTAIQNARTNSELKAVGIDLTRDESHLDKGIGRYIAALTLFEVLMNNNSNEVSFYPPDVDNAKYLSYLSKIAAKNAALNPFKVTGM